MIIDTVLNTLQTVGRISNRLDDDNYKFKDSDLELITSKGSITKLLSTFIINPTVILSEDLKGKKVADDLIKFNVDAFAAFYMQAFHVLVSQYGLTSSLAFDVLSSGYSKATGAGSAINYALESKDSYSLMTNKHSEDYNSSLQVGLEDFKDMDIPDRYGEIPKTLSTKMEPKSHTFFRTVIASYAIKERIVEMPITIRAEILFVPFADIVTLIEDEDDNKSFSSRYHKWRAGLITTTDLFLAGSLIDDYKKERIVNGNELLGKVTTRKAEAYSKLHSGTIGYNLYYSILAVTAPQADIIESKIKGPLNKDKYKEKLLEGTKSLIMNVVDEDYERVDIYVKDIKGSSDISYKMLKKSGEKDDSIEEILKALVANKSIL